MFDHPTAPKQDEKQEAFRAAREIDLAISNVGGSDDFTFLAFGLGAATNFLAQWPNSLAEDLVVDKATALTKKVAREILAHVHAEDPAMGIQMVQKWNRLDVVKQLEPYPALKSVVAKADHQIKLAPELALVGVHSSQANSQFSK